MQNDIKFNIASPEAIRNRIDELRYRSDEIKGRLAHTLIRLWDPERLIHSVDPHTDFSNLKNSFPQFHEVIESVENSIFVSNLTASPFCMGPILLQGEPGLGKTYFVRELANQLGLPYFEISLATISASFALCGGSLQWGEGTVGEIAKIITVSRVANPIVLLDEVDKCNQTSKYDPSNVLYGILEPHTAKRFKDEALELELDLSHVIWVATANYPELIPPPIRSRMRSFDIQQPSPEAMKRVVQHMYEHFRQCHPCGSFLSSSIDVDIVNRLSSCSPREIRITLYEAAMKALKRGSKELSLADLQISKIREVHRVGFI